MGQRASTLPLKHGERTDSSTELRRLGRGIAQLNLRMKQILERTPAAPTGSREELEILFDLVDAVENTLAAPVAVQRGWWPWSGTVPTVDLTGLKLARDHSMERLRQLGIEGVAEHGPVDPSVHRVVLVVSPTSTHPAQTVQRTHRRGWVRVDPHQVLRFAHVTATGDTP